MSYYCPNCRCGGYDGHRGCVGCGWFDTDPVEIDKLQMRTIGFLPGSIEDKLRYLRKRVSFEEKLDWQKVGF